MDEALQKAIREAARSGHRLAPRPPDSVLTALMVVACAGSVMNEALVSIAVRLGLQKDDRERTDWGKAQAWRSDLRVWLDSLGVGSPDWSKEPIYPKASHEHNIADALDHDAYERRRYSAKGRPQWFDI